MGSDPQSYLQGMDDRLHQSCRAENARLRDLLRQAMFERHTKFHQTWADEGGVHTVRLCGASIGTSIDTCEPCRPYREAIANA